MRARKKDIAAFPFPAQLLLSDTEVAAMLGIGVSTVWKKTNAPNSGFPKPFYITERARRWRKTDIVNGVKELDQTAKATA